MTKVTLHYRLMRAVNDGDAQAIADAHSVYGIALVKLASTLDRVTIDYDASRLTARDVESALIKVGVPIDRATASICRRGAGAGRRPENMMWIDHYAAIAPTSR